MIRPWPSRFAGDAPGALIPVATRVLGPITSRQEMAIGGRRLARKLLMPDATGIGARGVNPSAFAAVQARERTLVIVLRSPPMWNQQDNIVPDRSGGALVTGVPYAS